MTSSVCKNSYMEGNHECYNYWIFNIKEHNLSRGNTRQSLRFVNAQNTLLGIPLAVAIIFSFGFVLMQPENSHSHASGAHAADATSASKKAPLQATTKNQLPTLSTDETSSPATPNTTSPQNTAVGTQTMPGSSSQPAASSNPIRPTTLNTQVSTPDSAKKQVLDGVKKLLSPLSLPRLSE